MEKCTATMLDAFTQLAYRHPDLSAGLDELKSCLLQLNTLLDEYKSAVELLDFSTGQAIAIDEAREDGTHLAQEHDRMIVWRFIAGRSAALTVYHFRATMDSATSVCAESTKTLNATLPQKEARAIKNKLDDDFPDMDKVRHAIAHFGQSIGKAAAHTVSGPIENEGYSIPERHTVSMLTGMGPEHFNTTYNGRLISTKVSPDGYQRIKSVLEEFVGLFEKSARGLSAA